jgi:branched-chain amino acid transport system ATP-binding protein
LTKGPQYNILYHQNLQTESLTSYRKNFNKIGARFEIMEKRSILSTTGLSKYFGGLAALKKVDITVQEGQIHGLIGPNGAGKTTFANVVSGLLRPTEGRIYFNGTEITSVEPHMIASMGLSRTFQRAQIFPRMNCLQNVMVGHHPRFKTGMLKTMFRPPFFRQAEEEESKRRALELLQLVGLSDSAERIGTDLVWVECQLVQIARSIANEPKLLILDEPTSGMGVEESQMIGRIIKQVRDSGITIVLISHDVRLVMDNADWVTVLNFGEKICEETPGAVQCDAKVLEAYLGTEQ